MHTRAACLPPRFDSHQDAACGDAARSSAEIPAPTDVPGTSAPYLPATTPIHAPRSHSRDAALRPTDFSHWLRNEKSLVYYCTYHRIATLGIASGLDPAETHTVTIEIHPDQPDRRPVAFRLKDPDTELQAAKYQGTKVRTGQILLLGDLVP